jgi:hypothetical protein
MFVDYRTIKNQMQHIIEEGFTKSSKNLNISSDYSTAHANQHASNSSATHIALQNIQFGMPLNYFPSEPPSARATFPSREKQKSVVV